MLLCGSGGQRQVAHKVVGTAIGGRSRGDAAVHEVFVSQLILIRCLCWYLSLDCVDVTLSSTHAGFQCVDVIGVLLLSGLGASLFVTYQSIHLGLGVGSGLRCCLVCLCALSSRGEVGRFLSAVGRITVCIESGKVASRGVCHLVGLAIQQRCQFAVGRKVAELCHQPACDATIQSGPLSGGEARVVQTELKRPCRAVIFIAVNTRNLCRRSVCGRNLNKAIVIVVRCDTESSHLCGECCGNLLLGGSGGQRQVAYKVVGTAIGGRSCRDRAVHKVFVGQLILIRCLCWYLSLDGVDVTLSRTHARFQRVDVISVLLLSGLGASLFITYQSIHLGLGVGSGLRGGLVCLGTLCSRSEVGRFFSTVCRVTVAIESGEVASRSVCHLVGLAIQQRCQFAVRRKVAELCHQPACDATIQSGPLSCREAGVVQAELKRPRRAVVFIAVNTRNLCRRSVGGRYLNEAVVVVVRLDTQISHLRGKGSGNLLLCGSGGQTEVAHKVVGTAIGGRSCRDRAVHKVFVGQLILIRCLCWYLSLDGVDVTLSRTHARFQRVDVISVLLLSGLGASLFFVDMALQGRIGLLAGQCLRVDVVLQGRVGLLTGQCFRVDIVLQGCVSILTGKFLSVDVMVYALHRLVELGMQHNVWLVLDIRWRIDVCLIPVCLVYITTHQCQHAVNNIGVIRQECPRRDIGLLVGFYNLEHIHHTPTPWCSVICAGHLQPIPPKRQRVVETDDGRVPDHRKCLCRLLIIIQHLQRGFCLR